jgi:hypothetical protein
MRSLNAQIEFLLRDALRQAGRLRIDSGTPPDIGAPHAHVDLEE